MSSPSVALLGAQTPRVLLAPVAASSADADDAIYLASSYGLTPDEWQATVLRAWLGRRLDGRWAAPRCGVACPRQNGKNAIIEVRELFGSIALGEKILHTAHEVKTARKAFMRLLSFFEDERTYPELAALVDTIRKANGQEGIYLKNGGSIEFVARTKSSGRGFTVDVLICDEAQEMTDEALAALLPTISAAPLENPQTILTGTPPGPTSLGTVFVRMRTEGVVGKSTRLAWLEWSGDPQVDLDDPRQVAWANPGLGIRLDLETIGDERATMDDATYGRERLGLWDEEGADAPIPLDAWARCCDPESMMLQPSVLGLDVSPDRKVAAICAAGTTESGRVQIELTGRSAEDRDWRPGVDWVVPRLVEIAKRAGIVDVVVDSAQARALGPEIEAAGLRVTETKVQDVTASCAQLHDAVLAGEVVHRGELDRVLSIAKRRDIGDTGWAWGKRKSGDIAPLVAATLAHWGHRAGLASQYNILDSFY